jgi:acetate kinase
MNILTVNCGSSSLKLRLVRADGLRTTTLASGSVETIGPNATVTVRRDDGTHTQRTAVVADWGAAFGALFEAVGGSRGPIDAIGHRVVQGGAIFEPSLIDAESVAAIEAARSLAPLHNGPSLEGIRAAQAYLPDVPAVAVFDTEFHARMPDVATQYALPREVALVAGIRRYGYHGLAHRSMSERYAEITDTNIDDVSIITLQLGNGCSAAAVRGRGSVDTSMGFTPLEGLVMGTRCGDLDPAVVLYLQRARGMSPDDIDAMLTHRSGLLGVSGTSSDMAAVLAAAAAGDQGAAAAVDLFCYRVRKYIGAYIAVLGTVQAVVFGGGIGERAPEIRRRICEPLAPLGLALERERNAALTGDEGRFSTDASAIAAYVIPSDEERIIATETLGVLSRTQGESMGTSAARR